MLLPTILDVPRGQAYSDYQPCPNCATPLTVLRTVSHVGEVDEHDDDDDCDRIVHRQFVHGETAILCFPIRRPGGADGVLPGDWAAIVEWLRGGHCRR